MAYALIKNCPLLRWVGLYYRAKKNEMYSDHVMVKGMVRAAGRRHRLNFTVVRYSLVEAEEKKDEEGEEEAQKEEEEEGEEEDD